MLTHARMVEMTRAAIRRLAQGDRCRMDDMFPDRRAQWQYTVMGQMVAVGAAVKLGSVGPTRRYQMTTRTKLEDILRDDRAVVRLVWPVGNSMPDLEVQDDELPDGPSLPAQEGMGALTAAYSGVEPVPFPVPAREPEKAPPDAGEVIVEHLRMIVAVLEGVKAGLDEVASVKARVERIEALQVRMMKELGVEVDS